MKFDGIVILSVALCLVIVVGEVLVYAYDPYDFDAEVTWSEDTVDFDISSSGTDIYSAIVLDNGDFIAPTTLYIYNDENYGRSLSEAKRIAGVETIDIGFAIDQIIKTLNNFGFNDIRVCDSKELAEVVIEGDPLSKGILVLSYALPSEIYSGSSADPIFKWMSGGGSLYWANSPIGMFFTDEEGIYTVPDFQKLFFGKDCINTGDTTEAFSVIDANGITDALALKSNTVRFALDISDIEGALSAGYGQEGYSSISFVPFGKGMICVIGGPFSHNQWDDISVTIASGLSCYSTVIGIEDGTIRKATVSGSMDITAAEGEIVMYVSIGGYYPVYGRAFHA